jgi:6-phosphogluconolactonase (cycloisomerase 2 family)
VDPSGNYLYAVNNGGTNVSMYTINRTTGQLTSNGAPIAAAGTNTQAIRVDPTGRFAYVVNAGPFPGNGSVDAYSINGSGQLVSLGAAIPAGTQPTGLTIDPLGRFVYVANTTTNDLSIYSIDANGGPTSNGTLTFVGTQSQLGADGVAADPSGRFLYATTRTQGAPAKVIPYAIGSNGTLIARTAVNGSGTMGPVAVDPTGRIVHALDINNSFILVYEINLITGALTLMDMRSTGPAPNAIAVDPQGKFVYTTNSDATISIFRILSNGMLTLGNTIASPNAGTSPRGIVVSR